MDGALHLREEVLNLIENLALRLAQANGGRLYPAQLLPHLPLSMGLAESCLNELADGRDILREDDEHLLYYRFTAYEQAPARKLSLETTHCIGCDTPLEKGRPARYCNACAKLLKGALEEAADACGWPAQAVYEHELLHAAGAIQGPIHAEDLAARSRYTLRSTRAKLDAMSHSGYIEKRFDATHDMVVYLFPEAPYSERPYQEHMGQIRQFPAAMMEDVEVRVSRILFALGGLVLTLFVLAFLRIPLPLLLLCFLVGAPAIAIILWKKRSAGRG